MNVVIDDWWEMVIAAVVVIAVFVVAVNGIRDMVRSLAAFAAKHRVKAGPVELGGEEKPAVSVCAPYVEEHTEILARLEANMTKLTDFSIRQSDDIKALFHVQKAGLVAMKASLEAAQGVINGNVSRAIQHVDRAQERFDSHLMSRVGEGPDD